ncbi:MAG: flippase-like domain-containing protein [Rhodothermia bacterium]|nr:flippase-like domain-containing protein [Rhodothermia bacterium]
MSSQEPTKSTPTGTKAETGSYGVSYRNIVLSVLLSLAVVAVIAVLTYEPEAIESIKDSFDVWLMSLAVGTVVARILIGGWRLQFVSSGHLRFSSAVRGQLAWDFFSIVTPSVIGGGPLAAVYVARDGDVKVGEATALLFFAMLLDQFFFAATVPLIVLATFFMPVFPPALGAIGTWTFLIYFVGLLAWVYVFAYVTFFRPEVLDRWLKKVFRIKWLRKYEHRVATEMHAMQERAALLRSQPTSFFVKGSVLTLMSWTVRYALLVLIIWSVYDNLDVLLATVRTAALTLGSLVMPTPGGSGGVEGLYALFFGPPLMPSFLVAPTLLIWRIMGYYVYIALGGYLTMHRVRQELKARRNGSEATAAREDGTGTQDLASDWKADTE